MVSTEKNFKVLSGLYDELLRQTMLLNNIREIECVREEEHFFDRIVIEEGGRVNVYTHGLSKPFSGLLFDYTVDFATCLSYIEHDLFLAERKGKPERGMVFKFNN